jgi:hypothetical protein
MALNTPRDVDGCLTMRGGGETPGRARYTAERTQRGVWSSEVGRERGTLVWARIATAHGTVGKVVSHLVMGGEWERKE